MMKKSISALLSSFMLSLLLASSSSAQPIASKTDINGSDNGSKETSLGDLTADALKSASAVDMAFIPASALRSVMLPANGLTSDQLAGTLVATTAPANAYVTMRLKGKQIISALEHSVSHLPQSYDGFLQVSGIHVVYDPNKPEGSRIVSVSLDNGTVLSPDSQYLAVMTQPLGIGGMGYFQAWNQSDIVKTSDESVSTALVNYALAHQPIDAATDGRLKSQ
jgi:hypothetical protein